MTENLKIALSQLSESEANSNNNLACKGISKFQSCLKLKSRLSEGNVAEDFYYLGLNSLSHWPGEAQCNDSGGPKGLSVRGCGSCSLHSVWRQWGVTQPPTLARQSWKKSLRCLRCLTNQMWPYWKFHAYETIDIDIEILIFRYWEQYWYHQNIPSLPLSSVAVRNHLGWDCKSVIMGSLSFPGESPVTRLIY